MPDTKESDFIATARKRFQQAADDEKPLREQALIDLKFVAGDQWDPALKQQRENAGRPALTFPRCHTFVQQVSNEARQNKPQIKFAPTDDKADDDTAEVYEGLARHIQYSSDAQVAYETSVEYSAGGSFGYYRFLTEEDENGDQELKIIPVLDPFAVYGILVPACFGREPRFGFVIEDMPKEEYEDTYPDSAITKGGLGESDTSWLSGQGWVGTDTVRVAEYWYCEGKGRDTKVKFCKISGMEVLPDSKTDWLGYCVPIIPVLGKGMIIQGKPQLFSVVRYQRGAQQMINYSKTRIAESLATAPISPFMVAKGQIDKGDKKWENVNTQVYPYLEYNAIDVNNKPVPPPARQTFEPPIQALSAFVAQEIDDMKATTGIFDASLGQKSNETSGMAIARRQQQSNMTTMHFMDNLERAFKKGGLVMQDLIPKIYDTERMIRILGADEAAKVVKINVQHQDPKTKEPKHYKVGGAGAGTYHAIVTMGKAFSTKRMESFDMMTNLIQGNPAIFPIIGDVLLQNSDAAGADILAERIKKWIGMQYPGLIESDEQQDIPPQAQAIIAQKTMEAKAINAHAQQVEQELGKLQFEQKAKVVENQARMDIEKLHSETTIAVAEINSKMQNERERMKLEFDLNTKLQVAATDAASQQDSQAHDAGMQAMQQGHESGMADKNAEIAAQQAEQGHAQTLEQQQAAAELQPAGGTNGQ